jgi:alpha-tubulin suppressor-like RCC1 family protein
VPLAAALLVLVGCGRTELLPPVAPRALAADDAGADAGGADAPDAADAQDVRVDDAGDGDVRDGAAEVPPALSVAQIALGYALSCARLSDGTVKCWGQDAQGQLGVPPDRCIGTTPMTVPGVSGAVALAVGLEHACALQADGGIVCWGDNSNGELGDGTTAARAGPVTVGGVSDAVQLSLAFTSSCALRAGGTVRCWGSQTGAPAADVAGVQGATQISLSTFGSCAVLSDGTISCWAGDVMKAFTSGLTGVRQLSLGANHGCALLGDGTVRCWGQNNHGQLGDGTTASNDHPVPVVGIGDAVEVAAGYAYSCARSADGTVRCWGNDYTQEREDKTFAPQPLPAPVPGLSDARAIAAGYEHACARRGDGSVWCWGADWAGELGDGHTTTVCTPTPSPGFAGVVDLAAGDFMTCARPRTGGLTCAGLVTPLPTWNRAPAPIAVADPQAVVAAAVGYNHACLLQADGGLACWGHDEKGQLGDGNSGAAANTSSPVAAMGLAAPAMEISLGTAATCALYTDRTAACWGWDPFGIFGAASLPSSLSPTPLPVAGLANATQLVLEEDHACARLGDGTVSCWGTNIAGDLGDGTTVSHGKPAPVVGIDDAVEIAVGLEHACARHADGTVSCWGGDTDGELGDGGGAKAVPAPKRVDGLGGVAQIAAGGLHTCARLGDGTVSCWGSNSSGELGDGTWTSRATPTPVPGVTGAVQLALGSSSSCARLADATVVCWGNNVDGQLGLGWDFVRAAPVRVAGLP